MTDWKWIRCHEDIYDELKEIGQFGDSFSDILRKLLDSYYTKGRAEGPTVVGKDEVMARLKKFESHTKAIARLARQNISYSPGE